MCSVLWRIGLGIIEGLRMAIRELSALLIGQYKGQAKYISPINMVGHSWKAVQFSVRASPP